MLIRVLTIGLLSWIVALSLQPIAAAQQHDPTPSELSGFSVSEAFEIPDGKPLDVTAEKFHRILYRVLQTSTANLNKYARYSEPVDWEQLIGNPHDYRLWVFDRGGSVKAVQRIQLPSVDRETPIVFIYRADCISDSGQRFQVISLTRPSAWPPATEVDQPIRFLGFLYAMVDPNRLESETPSISESETKSESPPPIPLFVAKRLAWYPTHPDAKLGVTPSHVLLAKNGVDIGSLDLVRKEQNKKLESVDREPFFQFLNAVDKIPLQPSLPTLDCTELLRHPQQNIGNAVGFRARVRQCTPVQVPVSNADATLEFDRYFQLMVFPDLEGQIEVPSSDPDKSPLVYRRFPVTVCCRSLPPGITAAEIENQQIWVSGFYFRFWRYRSDMTDAVGEAGQLSPLIMARQPMLIVSDERGLNYLAGGLLVGLFVVLLALAWFYRNSRLTRNSSPKDLPEQIDLSGLE